MPEKVDLDDLYREICELVAELQDRRLNHANFSMEVKKGLIAVVTIKIPNIKKEYRDHGKRELDILSTSRGLGVSLVEIRDRLKFYTEKMSTKQ